MKNKFGQDVLNVSLPVVGEMTVYTFTSVINLMMIGNYGGNEAVSAIGLSNAFINIFSDMFMELGICIGVMSLVSRSIGAKRIDSAERYAATGFSAGLIISALVSLITFKFAGNFLYMSGARGQVLRTGVVFLKIRALSLFFMMVQKVLNSIMVGYGNTFVPFFSAVMVMVLNLGFNWALIYGNNFKEVGIQGAATASVMAYLGGMAVSLVYVIFFSKVKLKMRYVFKISSAELKKMLFLSIPSSLEEAAYSISRLLGNFLVMHTGSVAFAANEIANTVETISVMPGEGFGTAATALVGMSVGEMNMRKAKRSANRCAFWSLVMMGTFALIFLFMPQILVNQFVGEGERQVAHLAGTCLAIGALEQPFIAVSLVFEGALKGIGDTKGPFLISTFTGWAIRLPLIYVFVFVKHHSVAAVWWITAIQWGTEALLAYVLFKHKTRNVNQMRKHLLLKEVSG